MKNKDFLKEEYEIIKNDDSETLAARVALYRVLGSFKEEAKLSMAELMRRRNQNLDNYNFEEAIKKMVDEASEKSDLPSISEIKRNFIQNIVSSYFFNDKLQDGD